MEAQQNEYMLSCLVSEAMPLRCWKSKFKCSSLYLNLLSVACLLQLWHLLLDVDKMSPQLQAQEHIKRIRLEYNIIGHKKLATLVQDALKMYSKSTIYTFDTLLTYWEDSRLNFMTWQCTLSTNFFRMPMTIHLLLATQVWSSLISLAALESTVTKLASC